MLELGIGIEISRRFHLLFVVVLVVVVFGGRGVGAGYRNRD